MNDVERWQRVKQLLDQAIGCDAHERAALLDRECGSDSELRSEVESLVSSHQRAGSNFLGKPVINISGSLGVRAAASVSGQIGLSPGTMLGQYEVIGLIASGGMGEVYRARDTSLHRDVAIKVLPPALLHDEERLRRFEQEARATAALNHPNILAIFQMGVHDGAPYLVSELLDGVTLREHLARGPIPFRRTIDYATQISRGLAAAHDKEIVHRDLKPENLFIVRDGRLKILDFGLAKLRQRYAEELGVSTKGTESGMVMGTVGYMSPEQVSGKPADHRADIFALGAIIYESLTGQRAFRKPTSAETMAAILNEDPPSASQLTPGIPPALEKVVQRCLEKNPAQRFQSASDLAFTLEAVSDSGARPGSISSEPRKRLHLWWYAAIAAAVIMAALAVRQLFPRSSLVPVSDWVQITNFADSVTSPALSPDGRMLTFLRGNDTFTTPGQVYVMLLPHGDPVRLTNDSTSKMSPIFSPDGANIAYTVPWDTWTVPVLGGQPRLWLPNASGLSWLDADNLMFSQFSGGAHLELVSSDLSRAHEHRIYAPESSVGMVHRSYLSPDRKWVIAIEMTGNLWNPCRLVPFDGSTPGTPIGPGDGICTAAGWSPDGKWMYLNTNSGKAFHIWRQQFPNGRIEQVTSGPTEEEGIAVSPNGDFLVTAVGIRRSSVWLHDSHGDRALTSEGNAALANPRNGSPFSPDGKKFYYLVGRTAGRELRSDGGTGELWELDLQSGAAHAIMPGFTITDFSLSPDGGEIAFSALGDNDIQSIWVAPLDRSSSPRVLQVSANRPRFTREFIYYVKNMRDGGYVYRIRADGSGDERIWPDKIMALATSPDGRYLAVTVPLGGLSMWKLQIVDWARKRVQPVCNDAIGYWSDDGKSFVVTATVGKRDMRAPTYVVSLPVANSVPDLPPKGFTDISQFAALKHTATITLGMISLGKTPGTYAYVKETAQRNLYRIPLR